MAQSNERIGILGGTFNPIHIAHLLLAQEAWYRFDLSQVLLIPAARNPLREDIDNLAADAHRMQMLQLATKGDSRFTVDGCELRRGGASYTIETLRLVNSQHPQAELYLLMGADAALTLPRWKDISSYSALCTIVVCDRPGSALLQQGLPPEIADLQLKYELMPIPQLDISSSDIRRRLRQNKPIRYMVPDAVAEYIHRQLLYLA